MKTCWQILEIESTTQIDIIRQAYLARLPLCHPETDPQGFKALRQAYEEALRLAVNPVGEADNEDKDAACNQVNHLIPTRVLVKGGEITCKILK
ncbi:TPA: hypothetical protein RXQ20_002956 [Escherichia coli]|nr:hypothetical protein [Escherichia coli]